VTDQGGLAYDRLFTINVSDVKKEKVNGKAGIDVIRSGKYKDVLKGGLGDDTFFSGAGNDVLSGGNGRDVFVFDTKPRKGNVKKLTDFSTRDDAIYLDDKAFKAKVFKKIGKKASFDGPKKIKKGFFTFDKAKDKNDHLVYVKKKGDLYYDKDGSGKAKAVKIADFKNGSTIVADDFFLI
jgi:Ca2+-binding RTX toxin-like protein